MVRKHRINTIPERAAACLACACEDARNVAARQLLFATEALSATGVLAAIVIAESEEHKRIVELARLAIAEQREICRTEGPFREYRCGEHGLAALRRDTPQAAPGE